MARLRCSSGYNRRMSGFGRIWTGFVALVVRQPLLWVLLLVGGLLIVSAGRLAGYQRVGMGTPAERLYLRDGFHDVETGVLGDFRWTEPAARMILPHAGPGPVSISLAMFDAAPLTRSLRIMLDNREIYSGTLLPGASPTVIGFLPPAQADNDTPELFIYTDPWNPPGDKRALGIGLTRLEVHSPAAAARARWAEAALLVALLAIVTAVSFRVDTSTEAAVAALAVLGFAGPLMAYGDAWLNRSAPFILGMGVLASIAIIALPGKAGRARSTAMWGAVALAAMLLLITLARFNTGDAEGMFQITAGLAEDGVPWQHNNHEWIKFGLGQPLATLPLYWLGSAWAKTLHSDAQQLTRFCVALFNQLIIPATALVFFLGTRRRYGAQVALALAGTFLLATPAVAYARLAFAEPLSGFLILGSAMLLWQPQPPDSAPPALRRGTILGVGLCLGLAVLVKPANLIYAPVPALYLAWTITRDGILWEAVALRRVAAGLFTMGVGLLPGLLLTAVYNGLRYGSPFTFGYEGEGFTTPVPVGLYGLLFSPGKGIIYFAPPVLLTPVALAFFWRSRNTMSRAETLFIAGQAAIVLIFHAVWSSWEGNIAWGPRLILPIVPLLLWPLGALAQIRLARIGWKVLAVVGFLVAIPGALVDQFYYFDINGVYKAGTAAEQHMLFSPEWSQIVAHWRFLLTGTREALVRPTLSDVGLPGGWDTAIPVALVALALVAIVRICTLVGRPMTDD